MPEDTYAHVIVNVISDAVDRPFQYLIPSHLRQLVQEGSQVLVPFRSRLTTAYVVSVEKEKKVDNPREILEVHGSLPVLSPEFIELSRWLSRRFFCRQIEAINACLPPAGGGARSRFFELVFPGADSSELLAESARIKKKAFRQALILECLSLAGSDGLPLRELIKKTGASRRSLDALAERELLRVEKVPLKRSSGEKNGEGPASMGGELIFRGQQAAAWEEVRESLFQSGKPILIHGITGSGKTAIYLRAVEEVLKKGLTVLILVPEIALTPQMVEQFRGRFCDDIALLHSALSAGERYEQWWRVRNGEARVVLGARSAVFAPLDSIGLIIVDEEHENTYKQEDSPRYHALDVARWRAHYHGALLMMGSATPSLETYRQSKGGKVKLLQLTERVAGRTLPEVQVVDMRAEFRQKNKSVFSRSLSRAMERAVSRGEQVVLFLNRRGFAGFQLCRKCGYVIECSFCSVSLTYHSSPEHLQCHFCGYRGAVPDCCPQCKSTFIKNFGLGTQKVEIEVKEQFPGLKVIRMDSDTVGVKGAHSRIWSTFREREASVLIGTQMVAKGLHFPGVTLVGVVAADITLHLPDFRAGERTFQLLTQAAGRAGRGDKKGRVIIQTFSPWHYSIKAASAHDYELFAQEELERREALLYPPFADIILFRCSAVREEKAGETAQMLRSTLEEALAFNGEDLPEMLGPSPAPYARVRGYYRYNLVMKGPGLDRYCQAIKAEVWEFKKRLSRDVRVTVDFNPLVML